MVCKLKYDGIACQTKNDNPLPVFFISDNKNIILFQLAEKTGSGVNIIHKDKPLLQA
jgi:hypothetical protein